jgi:hypothetical protein
LDNVSIIDQNLNITSSLISDLFALTSKPSKSSKNKHSTILFQNVPIKPIKQYINNFQIAKDTDGSYLEFNREDLIRYIAKKEDALFSTWNVAIVSIGTDDDADTIDLNHEYKIKPVNRARLKTSPINGAYNIKAVSSKSDRKIDLSPDAINEYDNRKNPLLLLYFIDKNSKPMKDDEKSHREPLYSGIDANKHRSPVSYSIIFPPDGTSKGVYIQNI